MFITLSNFSLKTIFYSQTKMGIFMRLLLLQIDKQMRTNCLHVNVLEKEGFERRFAKLELIIVEKINLFQIFTNSTITVS